MNGAASAVRRRVDPAVAAAQREPEPEEPKTVLASPRPGRRSRLAHMPRWLRITFTACSFAMFFAATTALGFFGVLLLPLWGRSEDDRRRFTRRLNATTRLFAGFMRDTGLIDYWPPVLPEGFAGRPYLLVANHPTLIDVVLLLSSLPELTCVAKASWYRTLLMGAMLRRTELIPGAGYDGERPDEDGDVPLVRRMEAKLRSGVPLLVFPESSRSKRNSLRRFRRGSIEAAIRAGVPILPLFIGVAPALLMKGQPFYDVPKTTGAFTFEWFEPIETEGRDLDSRQVTRELSRKFQARFAKVLEERAELDASLRER